MTPETMGVCLVAPRFAPDVGGVEQHVEQLARHLAAAGVRVEVLTQATRRVVADAGRKEYRDGYVVRRFPLPYPAARDLVAPGLIRALRRTNADVVHAHNYHAMPAALAARYAGRRRFVLTPHYHGTGSTVLASAAHRIYRPTVGRRVMARADVVIAVSPSEQSLLASHFGPEVAARTVVVPNGARKTSRYPTSGGSTNATVLAVGRLEPHKRLDVLIRALAWLPDAVRLVVVGEGSQRSSLTRLATALGLADRVNLLGRVSDTDLDDLTRRGTVFATASRLEAFGLTLADAVASGMPTVASDIPAHRDVLTMAFGSCLPEHVALVANDAQPAAFATAIAHVLGGTAPPPPANALPDWADVATRTQRLYLGAHQAAATPVGTRTDVATGDRTRS